jgi:hypothetical protein
LGKEMDAVDNPKAVAKALPQPLSATASGHLSTYAMQSHQSRMMAPPYVVDDGAAIAAVVVVVGDVAAGMTTAHDLVEVSGLLDTEEVPDNP